MNERSDLLTTLEDFQNYINENNIKSKKEFRITNKYLYNRYIRLFSKNERNLKFKEERYHSFEDEFKTIDDFQKFINEHEIEKPVEFKRKYPKIYDRLCRCISKEEKYNLVYKNKLNSYTNIVSINDLQNFINENNVHSRKELHKRYSGLYVKFQKKLDEVSFVVNNKSLGENFLINLFNDNNIKYITEKTFPNLKNILLLRYDFYLPEYNILIEHHGEGHFGKGRYFSKELLDNDLLKYNYSISNNIPILYFTIYKNEYENNGYFTEVITDGKILIQKIKGLV